MTISTKEKFSIRRAQLADCPAIMVLIKELAQYEKAEDQVFNTVDQMHKDFDLFESLVVEIENQVIAFALFYDCYYTWVGRSLYLDDLYVKNEFRGLGIGTSLLSEVISIARSKGAKRVRWQVLDWNQSAIDFYKEKFNAELSVEWLNSDLILK